MQTVSTEFDFLTETKQPLFQNVTTRKWKGLKIRSLLGMQKLGNIQHRLSPQHLMIVHFS